ncbi:hypothetical protein HOY82DRAFT_495608, partial [Tuber indicum]
GISPYIDFIAGIVFTSTTRLTQAQYRILGPVLQPSCHEFIETCLLRFNEDLLNIADSDVAVGGTIGASPLETYAKLHPFAQATDHVLEEKCLHTLMRL